MKLVTTAATSDEAEDVLTFENLPEGLLRQVAETHHRAQRLLRESAVLVRQQQELEGALVALGAAADEEAYDTLREASGLAALDSVLGNVAAIIAAAGGGLWCGGPPRPWPETAWQLDPSAVDDD